MGKLVVLRLDGDSQQQGYRVNLAIGAEHSRPSIEITGYLPPAPELITHLQRHWLGKYRSLAAPYRLERVSVSYGGSPNQRIAECQASAQTLCQQLTQWLNSEPFLPIDRRLREELNRDDVIRFLIRTDDSQLHKLPWQEWDLFERYPKAEVALCATQFEQSRTQLVTANNKIRILAILGNSRGIDTTADRRRLETLPDAEVEFLVEPERQQLNDRLWEQPWDILFFAGHSETKGETGQIYINQIDSLSIHELKYGLRKAIAQGLQLAIFNSCDGLGLAYELEQLHIPQMIVMREPVPDKVAQEFLQYFLRAFAAGESLYLAERQARERLQGWEHQFPCASWLPVIYQNPLETPPDWQTLRGEGQGQTSLQQGDINDPRTREHEDREIPYLPLSPSPPLPLSSSSTPAEGTQSPSWKRLRLATVLLASVAVTSLTMAARYIGILEPLELGAYDYLMRQRTPELQELIDERILVVDITQADIAKHQYPLQDATLAQLLEKLGQYKPLAIGLDMHRSQLRGAGRADFLRQFKQNQNFFIVCALGSSDPNYAPPPEFSAQQLSNQTGFSDLIVDSSNFKDRDIRADLVVGEQSEDTSRTARRQLLSYDPSLSSSPTSCTTPYSLSFQLAFRFLYQARIQPMEVNQNQEWQLGTVAFKKLAARFGGYQSLDGQSSQIMINYRANQPGQRVTLQQVLAGQLDSSRVKDRIVLVGYTAPIAKDNFETPDGQMPGIWVHAHMVSQILSAVMEKRPLIWVLPQWGSFQWGDTLWVFAWSITGGLLVWGLWSKSRFYLVLLVLAVSGATLGLYQICLVLFMQGGWMPLVPSALALLSTGSVLVIYQISHHKVTSNLAADRSSQS